MEGMPLRWIVASIGFALGAVFGFAAHRSSFCTMGAISDVALMGDWRRLRAWALAIAVATVGSQGLDLLGYVDLGKTFYRGPTLGWAGSILGGGAFGFGMVLAGGCGSRLIIRVGGGSLKALVAALVLAVVALMTMRGLLATIRQPFEAATAVDMARRGFASHGVMDILARGTGIGAWTWQVLLSAAIGAGLTVWAFASEAFRRSPTTWIAAIAIGATVPAAWFATGVIGHDDFEPLPTVGLSFVAPLADGLQFMMYFTGSTLGFGAATVFGVIFGAAVSALASRAFRLEDFADVADLGRHLLGGALMGAGGVFALGCTIGQGLTGVATLALGSFLALGGIVLGAVAALGVLESGSVAGWARGLLGRG